MENSNLNFFYSFKITFELLHGTLGFVTYEILAYE